MTRGDRIEICRLCQNKKMDLKVGLVCGLTNNLPVFESDCEDFLINKDEQERVNRVNKNAKRKIFDVFFIGRDYYATPIILYLNITLYFLVALSSENFIYFDLNDLVYWGGNYKPLTLKYQEWRVVTSFFLHSGLAHLISNSVSLLIVGYLLEHLIGPRKFLSIYFLIGITASLTSLWWNDFMVSIGASGAIFGLYGVLIVLLSTKAIKMKNKLGLLIGVILFTTYNLINGFTDVIVENTVIDNAVHIGGFVSGVLIGLIIYPSIRWESNLSLSVFTQIFLIAGVLSGGYFALKNMPDNTTIYVNTMEQFVENEQEALFIFRLSTYRYVDSYKNEINDVGISNWQKNLSLLKYLEDNSDLPYKYSEKVMAYKKYCDLRIEQYNLMLKMIEEKESDLFGNEISLYQVRIDSIIQKYPL